MNDIEWLKRYVLFPLGVVGCIFSAICFTFFVLCLFAQDLGLSDNLMIGIESAISLPTILCLGLICSIIGLFGKPRYFGIIGCLFSVILLFWVAYYAYMWSKSEF